MTRQTRAHCRITAIASRFTTLRWRITGAITGLCCALSAILGVLVHEVVADGMVEHAREDSYRRLEQAMSAYVFKETGKEATEYALDPADLPARLHTLAQQGHQASMEGTHDGSPVMWAVTPTRNHVLAVWVDYTETCEALKRLDQSILAITLASSGTFAAVCVLIASRIGRRLRVTSQVATRISRGDLNARIYPPPGPSLAARRSDEVVQVGMALDTMAATLQERFQREQRFTADVAHELRTPLTGMVAATNILPDGRPKEMIRDRLQALCRLTEDLLEISRLDASAEEADLSICRLGALVEHTVRGIDRPVETEIVHDGEFCTDPRRVERILTNLIINAHRHGEPPVLISVDGPRITVRDHGQGYPPHFLAKGPQRFRTSVPERGKGHGLGLTIAVGQAHVLGATLHFSNAPDSGAQATLVLPATEAPSSPQCEESPPLGGEGNRS